MERIICTLCFLLAFTVAGFADTIILKNNKKIDGEIIRIHRGLVYVRLESTGKETRIREADIKEIRRTGPAEKERQGLLMDELGLTGRLMLGPVVPLGGLTDRLGTGFYGRASADVELPWLQAEKLPLGWRGGLALGIGSPSSKSGDYKMSILTFMAGIEAAYPFTFKKQNLRPFMGLNAGMAVPMLRDERGAEEVNESSLDGALMFSLGLAYRLPSVQRLEIIVDAGYLIIFEQVNGQFLIFEAGVSYRLGQQREGKHEKK